MCVRLAVGTRSDVDQLGERLAGADGRELVGVADEHHVHARADGSQHRDQQLEVGHRGLVDDEQVAFERVRLVVPRALAGDPLQRRVHGARLELRRVRDAAGGAAGRRDEDHRRLLRVGGVAQHPDRGRLAGARAAGDDRQAVREGVLDGGPLLGRRRQLVAASAAAARPRSAGSATPSSRSLTRRASSASSAAVGGR